MCRSVIIDAGSESQLDGLLRGLTVQLVLLCLDRSDTSELAAKFPAHRVLGTNDFAAVEQWYSPDVPANSIAYLLFTSGSTGQPKGVMVSHANVLHYVDYVTKRYGYTSDDRVSQTFDLTFDLSAHDMFVAWENGACVCCPTQKQLIKPGRFINDARLTAWFSVPSTAVFMRRLGDLNPEDKYDATFRFVSTPVATADLIVVPTAKNGPVVGVKPEAKGTIKAGSSSEQWRRPRGTPDVSSPLVHDGLVYLCREIGLLTFSGPDGDDLFVFCALAHFGEEPGCDVVAA